MSLGIPGKVIRVQKNPVGMTMGRVSFGGIIKDVSLAHLPDVELGDFVVVRVGFALSKVDECAATLVFDFLKKNSELAELEERSPSMGASEGSGR